jgi:4-diphosphocytidyl-2-C-methyl-D-erythritol kinase
MTPAARVRAQAKVNLTLRILAREATGYHQIETVFQRLDLADDVRLELTAGSRSLTCDGPMLPAEGLGPVEENLAWRAAAAYLAATGSSRGFRIEITKQIPTGGGLGGGSADAGAVLRLMDRLHGGLPAHQLLGLAAAIGADVPFMTQDVCTLALAWGRGDRLLGLPALPPAECLLVVAPFGVNTAAAYRSLADHGIPAPGAVMLEMSGFASWTAVAASAVNEFEDVVFPANPRLAEAFAALRSATSAGVLVRMSGSGSTLFALCTTDTSLPAEVPGLPAGFRAVQSQTATETAAISVE